jgi:hypothetical protein
MSDRRSERINARLRRRTIVALVAGPLAGLAIGGLVAAATLDGWGAAAIGIVLGGVVACSLLGLLWAGYSSLESPDPGREPSDTERPIADRRSMVREEDERTPDDRGAGRSGERSRG